MIALAWIFFFFIFIMAFWCLLFLFAVVVPGALKLWMLDKIAPKFIKRLAGIEN